MPPKSAIASIRVTRSSFDAEYHQLGSTIIDIISKAGSGKWHGSISFNFNDESFNARMPFAQERFPTQNRRFDLFFLGPIFKGKTSVFGIVSGENSYKQENLFAATPNGQFYGSNRSLLKSFYPWLKISHNLGNDKSLNISFNSGYSASLNNLFGRFDLPSRTFDSKIISHQLRISESGYIGKRFLNEIRFQYTNESLNTAPLSDERTTSVLDAFNDGGAGNKYKSAKQSIWLADNLLFGAGKIHALKVGGLFEYEKRDTESAINQNGTFTFSSLNDFILETPTTFTQSPGTRKVNLAQTQIGAFIQDDIRLHKSFMLSAGLRYEWQNNLLDKTNFSPRLGFTWSPSKTGKLTFRGGAGIYYNWLETNNLATVLSQDINQPSEIIIINPSYPDPLNSGLNQILPQSYRQLAANLKNPYIFLASIGMERQLSKITSLRVLYKYQKGIHQFRSRDINAPLADTLIRPNSSFGRIVQVESSAFFVQNSLNVGLNGRFNKKISYGLDYTLAKNISDADGVSGLPSNNYDLRLDRSFSNIDQRHRIYASVFWRIRKGLSLSTIYLINSPMPYNITTGFDNNLDTVFNDRLLGISRNSERGMWQKQINTSLSWTTGFGEKSAKAGGGFVVITGDEPVDTGAKYKYSVKIFMTANNILNQTNFTQFVGVRTSPFFRQPIMADNPRRIDFGLRFSF